MLEAVQHQMTSVMTTIRDKFESEQQDLVSKIKQLEANYKAVQRELVSYFLHSPLIFIPYRQL